MLLNLGWVRMEAGPHDECCILGKYEAAIVVSCKCWDREQVSLRGWKDDMVLKLVQITLTRRNCHWVGRGCSGSSRAISHGDVYCAGMMCTELVSPNVGVSSSVNGTRRKVGSLYRVARRSGGNGTAIIVGAVILPFRLEASVGGNIRILRLPLWAGRRRLRPTGGLVWPRVERVELVGRGGGGPYMIGDAGIGRSMATSGTTTAIATGSGRPLTAPYGGSIGPRVIRAGG